MHVAIGSDHAGLELKDRIAAALADAGHEVDDLGTYRPDSCDYPDFAAKVAGEVAGGRAQRGILVCATGVGMSMAANKIAGIRAALCNDLYTARFARLHNDANLLALGARVVGPDRALEIVDVFLDTEFEGGRHQRRVDKIMDLESNSGRCEQ